MDVEEVPRAPTLEPAGSDPDDAERTAPPPAPAPAPAPPVAAEAPAPSVAAASPAPPVDATSPSPHVFAASPASPVAAEAPATPVAAASPAPLFAAASPAPFVADASPAPLVAAAAPATPVAAASPAPPVVAAAPEFSAHPDVSPPPAEANGSFDRRKRRKTDEGDGIKSCSCRKSKCVKLYCVCLASGLHCTESCGCEPCLNKPNQGTPRSAPAPVFPLKFVQTSEAGQDSAEQVIRSPVNLIRRKCACKKSACLKKYCDCYQGRAGCSINCKCDDCKNPFGQKVGIILDGKSSLPLDEGNESESDSSDDEDDYYMNRALSPIPQSPVSRESSFQQETLVGAEIQTMNGHLYPKPLTQVRPDSSSWQLTRRPGEEARGEQWNFSRRSSEDGTTAAKEGHNGPKFQKNNKRLESHVDRFSISRCIEVMNTMADLSLTEKSQAPDVFLDPINREIFLTLSVDIRTLWLKRRMKSLA